MTKRNEQQQDRQSNESQTVGAQRNEPQQDPDAKPVVDEPDADDTQGVEQK